MSYFDHFDKRKAQTTVFPVALTVKMMFDQYDQDDKEVGLEADG